MYRKGTPVGVRHLQKDYEKKTFGDWRILSYLQPWSRQTEDFFVRQGFSSIPDIYEGI